MSLQNQSTNRANSKLVSKHRPKRFLTKTPLSVAITLALVAGAANAATVQGIKFNDTNANGVYDNGEVVFSDQVLQLIYRNADGTTGGRWNTTTGQDGHYTFQNLINNAQGGTYELITATPRDAAGVAGCFTGKVQEIKFTNTDIVDLPLAYQLPCKNVEPKPVEPAIAACNQPTISTVKSGKWTDPTVWSIGRVPNKGDNVLIAKGHEITVDTPINVEKKEVFDVIGGAVCNAGTLKTENGQFRNCAQPSTPAKNIDISAMYLVNYATGIIKAGNGGSAPSGAGLPCPSERCGEGQNAIAGDGGSVFANATAIINEGLVVAGNGGHAGAAHAIATAGNGGSVDFGARDSKNSSSMPLESGDGGNICAPITWWQDRYGRSSTGQAGSIFVSPISNLKGKWDGSKGQAGKEIYYDPIYLKPSADFSMVGFDKAEIYTDEGGEIDFTQLQPGAISNKVVRISTKSLNGQGGVLNLTGIRGKVITATERVEIYADQIKLDTGVNIRDLIDAPNVVIEAGKVPYFVTIAASSLTIGQPGATVNIPVSIHNIGPKVDTFTFKVTDEHGWLLGTLADVTVSGYETKVVNLDVTLPTTRGAYNVVQVVGTSTTYPANQRIVKIGVEVNAGVDSDGDGYPDSLDAFPNDPKEWLDSDKDGIGDNLDTDDDNDGMPDVWELKYQDTLNPVFNDAADDADKDGFTNLEEFKAGTDPSDANSKPVVATPKVDLWIADPSPDDGTEPGKADWIWVSPNVWVRNQADDKQGYQNPIFGQDNYVYVSIKNRGTLASTKPTKVEVYRSGASMGRGWPVGWDLVGTAVIDTLGAGKDTTVGIKWDKDKVPAPGHYCFYARVVSDEDPMFAVEGNDLVLNTRQNNNVAWRNFDVVGLLRQVTDTFQVNVGNPAAAPKTVAVVFNEQENLLQNDGAKVTVDLGAVLFQRWQQAGGQGENIKVLNGTEVQLLATPAKLIGLALQANEQLPITMRVEAFKPAPGAGVSREYHFSAQELEGTTLIGGVDYAIITRAQDTDSDGDGIKDVVDTDNDNDGIPDEWEAKYGLNLLDATDASGDMDKDGVSNLDEFKANTVPTDATSLPKPAVVVGEYTAYGTIKDKAGAALAGATVQVGDSKTTTTDAAGNWSISGLIEGKYTVVAVKDNFRCFKSDVEIGNEQYQQQVSCSPVSTLRAVTIPHTWANIPESKEITYTNTLLNGGSQTATGIVLKATLPVGSELVSLEGLDGAVCDAKALSCNVPDLTPGATANMKLVVRAVKAGLFENAVTVTSNEYPVEVAKTWSTVKPHFSVNFTSTPKPVVMEGVLHYQAAVELSAFAPKKIAKGVTLNMLLPSGTKLQDISTKDGACDDKDFPKVVCQLNDLSIEKADSISRAVVDLNVKLQDTGLLVLTADAKATAIDYPAHTKLEKTSVLVPPEEVDIALLLDTTFSMHQEKSGVIQGLTKFIDDQIKTGKSPRVALIEFKDNVMLRYFGSDMQLLKKIIEGLQVDGGGECPEASGEALHLAGNHIKVAGTVMLITDAPPYANTNVEALLKRLEEKKVNFIPLVNVGCTTAQ